MFNKHLPLLHGNVSILPEVRFFLSADAGNAVFRSVLFCEKSFRKVRRLFGSSNKKIKFLELCPECNDDDRRQRRKQGGVVGAAASKTHVPPKARCGCWVPQPDSGGHSKPFYLPASSTASTAFWTCRRFSASSKISSACCSNRAVEISSPRWAGRQCSTMASGLAASSSLPVS